MPAGAIMPCGSGWSEPDRLARPDRGEARHSERSACLSRHPTDPGGRPLTIPAAVLERHDAALAIGDVDAMLADYTEDAAFIGPMGVLRGHDQIAAQTPTLTTTPKP